MTSGKLFAFGPFRVDLGRRILTRDGEMEETQAFLQKLGYEIN